MRNGKFTVRRLGDVFVVSDDGRIARQLGLREVFEWHLVAPSADLLGDRIDRMSRLLDAVMERTVPQLVSTADLAVTVSAAGPTQIDVHLPTAGSQADRPINELPAKPQIRWRLKRAGIESIGQLAGFSPDELTELPGLGRRTAEAAQVAMTELGYRLKRKIS